MEICLKDIGTDKLEKYLNRIFTSYENNGTLYTEASIGYREMTKRIAFGEYEITGCEVRMYNPDYAFTDFTQLVNITTINSKACYTYEKEGEYKYVDKEDAVKYAAEELQCQYV